ncbi:MAG: serine hydrolase, partial [Desulfobacterales bacterium]
LIQSDRLSLEDRLGDVAEVFAPSEKAGIRIRQLLSHQSGFPAWRPYFEILRRQPPAARGSLWRQMLAGEPLAYRPGEQTLYSDLDFMALQIVVEARAGQRLDQYAARELYQPMGLRDLFFTDTALPPLPRSFAATEQCPWRGRVLKGHVHDDNAFALGGVAGHAGLFGTAAAVADLLDLLLAAVKRPQPDQVLDAAQLRRFFQRQPSSDWTLGFDTPAATGSSSGRHFSASTVGHLGFTGTSFWMDLDREVFVVLLTNRIHPSRTSEGIKAFRPLIHDRIMEVLGYG